MTAGKIAALALVYILALMGWGILGGSIVYRQQTSDDLLRPKVEALWGTPLVQSAPTFTTEAVPEQNADRAKQKPPERTAAQPASSAINVDFHLNFRRKGLLWYRTYDVTFDGAYTVRNEGDKAVVLRSDAVLPSARQTYDDFQFEVEGGPPAGMANQPGGMWSCSRTVPAGETATVRLRYKTRGLDRWGYRLAPEVACVRNLDVNVTTDFGGFDFPLTSPTTPPTPTDTGYRFSWNYKSLLSGLEIALDMPTRLNPGPLASRISFFAPVGLLFFMVVMVLIGAVRDRNLHPMHYLFVCAAFFAFHLLFSYLVDLIEINAAFVISAAVSVLLVASYVVRFMGARFTLLTVAPAQVIYLILFSYAFFFQGYTGLTITIASILTLAALMQLTARIDWDRKLAPRRPPTFIPAPPPPPNA